LNPEVRRKPPLYRNGCPKEVDMHVARPVLLHAEDS
jgi:hypothetical protein